VWNARDDARRKHYLLTWPPNDDPDRRGPTFEDGSKAELTKAVREAYSQCLGSPPARYVTVTERTKKGRAHGHMALQHTKLHRWRQVAERLREMGFYVDFRETDTYPRATKYITETSPKKCLGDLDASPLVSPGHPPLRGARRTSDLPPPQDEAEDDGQAKKRVLANITPEEFYDICVDQNIRTRAEVMAYSAVDRRLVKFVMRQGHRLEQLLSLAAELQRGGAPPPPRPSRLALLDEAAATECACAGKWPAHAKTILQTQGLVEAFPRAMYKALKEGRGKGSNLWLCGETNRGKSFLLEPLGKVFHLNGEPNLYENPAEGKFNMESLPGKDVAFLEDFRVEENLFPWRIFLVWLDGRAFAIPRPRNLAPDDHMYKETAPVLVTTKEMPTRRRFGVEDRVETDQLRERFNILFFPHRIQRPEGEKIPPCASCWAALVKCAWLKLASVLALVPPIDDPCSYFCTEVYLCQPPIEDLHTYFTPKYNCFSNPSKSHTRTFIPKGSSMGG
jgi:hypothetical protein